MEKYSRYDRDRRSEIEYLKEKIRTNNFTLTEKEEAEQAKLSSEAEKAKSAFQAVNQEYQKASRSVDTIKKEIYAKQAQIDRLGLFKGKEKKELQAQISVLKDKKYSAEYDLSECEQELDKLKKEAEEAETRAKEFQQKSRDSKIHNVQKRLRQLDPSVGDIIEFGNYPNSANGKVRPITWKVLDRDSDMVLLLSEYALDYQTYNAPRYEHITWQDCTLRSWLNHDFYNAAFNSEEKFFIDSTYVVNHGNPVYHTSGGPDTRDNIFCLSVEETERYLPGTADKACKPTSYAKAQGLWASDLTRGCCSYWLRTPGTPYFTTIVVHSCHINDNGVDSSYKDGVRPALWKHL